MTIEEEIKLTASSAAVLDALATDPVVLTNAREQALQTRTLLATYYDTADHRLLQHQLAFRLRQESSGGLRANLKGTGGMVDGVSRRQEWEERLTAPITRWGELPDGTMREQILAVLQPDEPLVPLFVTDFQRRLCQLQLEDSRAEMALDQGEIRTSNAVHPLCEVELERLEGPLAPIRAFADDLLRRYALVPSQRSKFGLGMALLGRHEDM
ncbi:MAG: CYTH domain-containing protein [Magnetococcus sp. DMHC-8]